MTTLSKAVFGKAAIHIAAVFAILVGAVGSAAAGEPLPWQIGLQDAVTPVMEQINSFHNMLTWIIVLISVFVLVLLLYVMVKFNEKSNPNPTKTTHNTMIEVAWTVIPVIILAVIAVPSFRLLYFQDVVPEKYDMTIKTTGHQWYWSYVYPDHGDIEFDSVMIADEDIKPGQKRLLDVDNKIVIPVNKTIRLQIAAADVLHSWAIPAFGVKMDAVPGRLNETWFKVTKPGVYYGQCSELCGVNHGFMPIRVDVVTQEEFDAWIEKAKKEFAAKDAAPAKPVRLAQQRPSAE